MNIIDQEYSVNDVWCLYRGQRGINFFLNSSSKSYQTNNQLSGGTQTEQAGQAVGENNAVNTGTVTTVDNSRETDVKFGNVGNNSTLTYNTGFTADDVAAIGNVFSGKESQSGGSGVTLNLPGTTADQKTQAQSKLVKYGIIAAVVVAFLFGAVRLLKGKSK